MALNGIKMDGQSYTYALLDDKRMTSLQGQAVIHYILLSTYVQLRVCSHMVV